MRRAARASGARAAGAAGLAYLWAGPVAAGAAAAGVVAAAVVAARREAASRPSRIDDALPAFVESVAAAVRAGASLPRAVAEADAAEPLGALVHAFAARVATGMPVSESLDAFAAGAGTTQARLVCTALAVGYRSGGDVPAMLDVLATVARDRRRVVREARVASAQARLSAWVVAALPVVFLFLTGATSRDQARLLFGTPAGWGMLGAGALLEAAGIVWMRRLAATPSP